MIRRYAILAAVAAIGLAAALALTARPAEAYDINSLPAGYHTQHIVTSSSSPCNETWIITGYGQSSAQLCADSATFDQDVDAFVRATCPVSVCVPPVTTTTAAPTDTTVTTAATTTAQTTTTTAQPIATTTATTPAETVTVTTAVTTTITDPTINTRLTALEGQYAALAARVDAIANANTASWDAFIAAVNSGASTVDAALAARSAGWNAVFML